MKRREGSFMNAKRFMAAVLGILLLFTVSACNKTGNTPVSPDSEVLSGQSVEELPSEIYEIKIWVPEEILGVTENQVAAFNALSEDGITVNAVVEAVGEAEAAERMLDDTGAGGDIYCFSQDDFARLVKAGALARAGKRTADHVKAENSDDFVSAVSAGNDIYGFPLAYNGGDILYYDKSVIPESDADDLDAILEICEDEEKYIAYAKTGSTWFGAGFFFATGCREEWVKDKDGEYIPVKDTLNSEEGLTALKGLQKLVKSDAYLSENDPAEAFDSGAAAFVGGAEDFDRIEEILGEDLGVCELPYYEIDGKDYHLSSYTGYHLMGVKPQVNPGKQEAVNSLAVYLSGEECQRERLVECGWTPSNFIVRNDGTVKDNSAHAAIIRQAVYDVPKGKVPDDRLEIGAVFAKGAKEAKKEKDLQAVLDDYTELMEEEETK